MEVKFDHNWTVTVGSNWGSFGDSPYSVKDLFARVSHWRKPIYDNLNPLLLGNGSKMCPGAAFGIILVWLFTIILLCARPHYNIFMRVYPILVSLLVWQGAPLGNPHASPIFQTTGLTSQILTLYSLSTPIKFWRYNKVNLATLAFCAALAQTQRDRCQAGRARKMKLHTEFPVLHAESSCLLHAKDFLLYFAWPLIVTLLRV